MDAAPRGRRLRRALVTDEPVTYPTGWRALGAMIVVMVLLIAVFVPLSVNRQRATLITTQIDITQPLPSSFATYQRNPGVVPELHQQQDGTTTTSAVYNTSDATPAFVALLSTPESDTITFATNFGMLHANVVDSIACGFVPETNQSICARVVGDVAVALVGINSQPLSQVRGALVAFVDAVAKKS